MSIKSFTEENFEQAFELINNISWNILLSYDVTNITKFIEQHIQSDTFFINQLWEWFRNTYQEMFIINFDLIIPPWLLAKLLAPNEQELLLTLATVTLILKVAKNTENIWLTMTDEQKELLLYNLIGKYA